MELDETTQRILQVLREDARLSFREVAERVGVSPPTVSRRVADLEDLGLLRGYQAVVDPLRAGERVSLLTVRGPPERLRTASEALGALPGVREVLLLTGSRLHLRVHHRDARELDRVVEALEDVEGVEDVMHQRVREVLEAGTVTSTSTPGAGDVEDADIACHQCGGPIHGPPVRTREAERLHVFCCTTCRGRFQERLEEVQARGREESGLGENPPHEDAG